MKSIKVYFYLLTRFLLILLLIVSFILSSSFSVVYGLDTSIERPQQTGSVEEENPFLGFIMFTGECMYNLLMATGAIIGDVTEIDTLADICRSRLIETGVIIQDSNTNNYYIQETISASTLLDLRNLIEQNMKSKEPYEIYYPSEYPTPYYDASAEGRYILPSDASAYVKAREYFDTFYSIGYGNNRFSLIDSKKFKYAYKSGGYIRLVDSDINSADAVLTLYTKRGSSSSAFVSNPLDEYTYESIVEFLGEENVSWSDGYEKLKTGTKSDGTPVYQSFHSGVTRSFYGQPIRVFNSLTDLYNYVSSKPTAYYTTDYYNKTYNDITLNQDIIKNYTTENVQNIYNTVNNNAGDALSADELQSIIDSTVAAELDRINGSLDDVNTNLEGVNAALDKILKSLDKSGEELKAHTSWLEKIYKVLQHMDETLLVISSDLDQILEDDGLLDQQTSISSLTAVLNIFLYGVPEPEDEPAPAAMYYDDSSGEYVEEPVMLSARYASRSGGGVVGLMFDKFPFCVPWDVYYCFLSLAETPEAPHFTFPFVIDSMGFRYEFTFYLSSFSMLSELCRMFLTLTFVVYMTHLTKKIVGGK